MSGFEIPSVKTTESPAATKEKESHIHSLEEIKNQLERFSGRENIVVVRTLEDEKGIYLHEVIFTDEEGNDTLYFYSRTSCTSVNVAYFKGKLENDDYISGETLSDYNEVSGEWKDQ